MPPMSASEHLLSRIRAHIPAGYWRVLSVYRVAHGGATSAAVRKPVCSLLMVVTGSLALGMDGGGAQTRWAAARTCNPWASAAALAASRRVDAGCSSCAPGCCPARRSPSGRVGSRPPGPDQGALARAPTRPAPSALPRSAFAVPARTALRACAPLAILTVPACSLGRRATAGTASAADAPMRGAGGRGGCTRARESSRLVLLRRLGGVRGRRRSRVARRRRHFAAAVCVCVCACVCHLSEVFLMPNTHTGPGAGRWEGGGVQTSGRYNLMFYVGAW